MAILVTDLTNPDNFDTGSPCFQTIYSTRHLITRKKFGKFDSPPIVGLSKGSHTPIKGLFIVETASKWPLKLHGTFECAFIGNGIDL